ncbi:uncharacterized protein LOC128721241 [Anopheles nili]|uniref:uncharacterized protein LOC128721241 n=1 Tax=Anopheles nili TaxID=185578 RepID=UPI00237AD38D|nr:uncharacterized protein LOC128721241 [Anopheles nili]
MCCVLGTVTLLFTSGEPFGDTNQHDSEQAKERAKRKVKAPKVSPEELLESLQQAEAQRYAEEQERFHEKVALELREYKQRRVLLMETGKFFRRLEKAASDDRRQRASRKEWTDFLSCRKSPSPTSPPEMRECLFRWAFQQEAQEKSSVSWTLAADERSAMTQNPSRKRITRKDLREAFRNIGGIYFPTIREALAVLEAIQDNTGHVQPEAKTKEVTLVQDEIRKFISDSLDKMTRHITSNIVRDMETLNPVMGDFQFQVSDVLAMYLWTFRPVPLPPNPSGAIETIHVAPLNLVLHRPTALELKDCFFRGLWMDFDHYSHMDPTKVLPALEPFPELMVAQETEWNERQEVRRKRLTTLRQQRVDYENEQRRKQAEAEALEAQKKQPGQGSGKDTQSKQPAKKAADKKRKSAKQAPAFEPEPAVITDETEVDIDAEFEHQECDGFWQSLASVAPSSRPLRPGYVNLREYSIVGGVYKLVCFDELPQPVEHGFHLIVSTEPVGLRLTEKEFRAFEDDELIKIELQLPAHCHWWEEPTVCCWEPWEESEQFIQLQPEVQQFHLCYDELEAHKATLLFAAPERRIDMAGEVKTMSDFSLQDIPTEVRLYYLIRQHVLPRVPERYRFRAELNRLYCTLKERAERRRARDREQLKRDGMLQKYDRFLNASHQPRGGPSIQLSEMRHPIDADKGMEDNSDAEQRRSSEDNAAKQPEMDEKLPQFSLAQPDGPRYLHPPVPLCPALVVGQSDGSNTSITEMGPEMEALVQRMVADDTMLVDDSDEQLCKLFSTFMDLLEYLREKEKPKFEEPPPQEVEVQPIARQSRVQQPRQRLVEVRTTKKYPLGLGPRVGSQPRLESARSSQDRKKRKQKKSLDITGSAATEQLVSQHQDVPSEPEPKEALSLIEHEPGRWSTKPIRRQSYDPDQRLVTFYTDRLGTYALAARKYCNIPFLHWDVRRHGRVANLTTTVTLSTRALRMVFYVTMEGYRVELYDQRDPNLPPAIMPTEGAFSLMELEKSLHRANVHVFPEVDTCFYVPDTVPKHQPMEAHSLQCLALFCLTHNFQSCLWNRYANRRTALVLSRELIEGRNEPEFTTALVTPLKAQFVEVEELCSSSLEEVLLAFHPRPEEQSYNADWYGLLKDGLEEPSRKVLAKTPPVLQWHVGQLLQRLQLLSYS